MKKIFLIIIVSIFGLAGLSACIANYSPSNSDNAIVSSISNAIENQANQKASSDNIKYIDTMLSRLNAILRIYPNEGRISFIVRGIIDNISYRENEDTDNNINNNKIEDASYYKPKIGDSFEWVLVNESNDWSVNIDADIVDIDAFDATKELVEKFHNEGKKVVAYISVGSREEYRDDADEFDDEIIGSEYPGWDGEKFLDIRNYEKFQHIIENRFDMIKDKGFDGIEPDNMDMYVFDQDYAANITSFDLTPEDSIRYIKYFTEQAHKRGLFILAKNGDEIVDKVSTYFDGALLEDKAYYDELGSFDEYIKQGKPVFAVEYSDMFDKGDFLDTACSQINKLGYFGLWKHRDLTRNSINCND